ncbi:MAG: class I SAM-dependent methyltransferase [Bacteroidetes bacterium]|nr:class I SAM-dependent methyltransferase [Bacteroidota bacterium]
MNKSIDYFKNKREEMLEYVPLTARKILDVGCGEGIFINQIKERQEIEAWGVEINKSIAEKAKDSFNNLYNSSVEEAITLLPKKYFDCIVFNDVLEHTVNPLEILKDIKGNLADDGCIVASIPNVRFLPNLYHIIIHKDWKYDEKGGILDDTHLRFFTKKSIVRLFDDAGYVVEKIEGINSIELFKYKVMFALGMGFLEDTKYMQFACRVRKK